MNNNQSTETPYARKVGFFGSVKKLGVTTVAGANDVVQNGTTMLVQTTDIGVTITSIASKATTLWGQDLIADLEADAVMNGLHREIETIQQTSELDTLKARIAEMKAKQLEKANA